MCRQTDVASSVLSATSGVPWIGLGICLGHGMLLGSLLFLALGVLWTVLSLRFSRQPPPRDIWQNTLNDIRALPEKVEE